MSNCARKLRSLHSREHGQALVLFAGGLAGLLGLVGIAIDIGHLVYTKTDLQKVADAAALAGAQDLNSTPEGKMAAETSAQLYAQKNGLGSCPVGSCVVVTASQGGTKYDTITVTASRWVGYDFLKVIGLDGATPAAKAVAIGSPKTITGYSWSAIAPFVIWGGSRQHEVHAGDASCALHICVGASYSFLDNQWMNASGTPNAPDWTASGSNNFKGDLNHGAGSEVNQIGDLFSDGGLGSITAPAVGSILVIPIVNKASGNSNLRTFRIAAWAIVKVDAGCKKQGCTGTIQSTSVTPPPGWDTSGSVPPPATLTYVGSVYHLSQ